MPCTISIRERGTLTADPVVSIDGQEYPFTLQNPFSPEDEQRLEWYFERYLNFPFTDQVKAQAAGASVRTYGEQLFDSRLRRPRGLRRLPRRHPGQPVRPDRRDRRLARLPAPATGRRSRTRN